MTQTDLSEVLPTAAHEIAHCAGELARLATGELSPDLLDRLGQHAAMISTALSEFAKGCADAAKRSA
jgi:hypothetical protein